MTIRPRLVSTNQWAGRHNENINDMQRFDEGPRQVTSNKGLLRVRTTTNGRVPLQIAKSATKNNPKSSQIPFKSKPRDHLRTKKHMIKMETPEKPNFRGWVPQDASQKGSKFDLEEAPNERKWTLYIMCQKKTNVGYCLEAPRQAFEDLNGCLWDTCRRA